MTTKDVIQQAEEWANKPSYQKYLDTAESIIFALLDQLRTKDALVKEKDEDFDPVKERDAAYDLGYKDASEQISALTEENERLREALK